MEGYQLNVSVQILQLLCMHGHEFLLLFALLHGCNLALFNKLFGVVLVLFTQTAFLLRLVAQRLVAGHLLGCFDGHTRLTRFEVFVLPIKVAKISSMTPNNVQSI